MEGILKGYSSDFTHVPVSTIGSCGSCFIMSCGAPEIEFRKCDCINFKGKYLDFSNSGDFLNLHCESLVCMHVENTTY